MSAAGSINRTSLISRNRWLWWKEFRMLLPLIVMLLVVAAIMFVATAASSDTFQIGDLRPMILVAFPSLFAVGCGAVMVGQEREQKTIDWMSSLPLAPRQWITVKFTVAMVGLFVMWLFALLFLVFLDDGSLLQWSISGEPGQAQSSIKIPFWILQSVYLTICGFYTSWRIRHSFHAIVAVVALGCLPIVCSEILHAIWRVARNNHLRFDDNAGLTTTLTIALIPVVGWLAYRAAMKTMLPQADGLSVSALHHSDDAVSSPSQDVASAGSFWSTAPMMGSSWSSMIWQSIRSAPLAIAIPTVLLLTIVVSSMLVSAESISGLALLFLICPLAVSWLGVLVFQNDGSAEGVRFLADRGVSPTKVFLTRHAVPFAILCACLSIYAWLAMHRSSMGDEMRVLIPSFATVGLMAWVLYSVSQWASQLFRTLVLSVIVSPIVALMVLGWFVWSIGVLQTPIWLLAVCSLVPMLTTWWMMQRYMDLRDRPHSFVAASMVLAVLIGVPVLSATMRVRQIPTMASAKRSELLRQGETIRRSSFVPIVLTLAQPDYDVFRQARAGDSLPVEDVVKWLDTVPKTPEQLIPRLADVRERPRSPASADKFAFFSVYNELMYRRLHFESDSDSQAAWDTFAPWLEAAADMSAALRRSTRWNDQDTADMLEIWIGDTLRLSAVQDHPEDALYQAVVAKLVDSTKRNTARRRAVLATWARHLAGKPTSFDKGLDHQPAYLATWMRKRRADSIAQAALDGLDGIATTETTSTQSDDWLRRMHEFQLRPTTPFPTGPYAPRLRDRPAIELIRGGGTYPARFWGMNWESQIDTLIQEHVK
ncbi:MAG: hypothetical protein WBD20_20910 [Pirellulaceae bacterium]